MSEHDLQAWIVKILIAPDAETAKGTGFWVAGGGYVLTCTHVVEGLDPPWIAYGGQKAPADVVAQDRDLTLLKVQDLVGSAAPLGMCQERWYMSINQRFKKSPFYHCECPLVSR